jgi:hypothetical protein
MKMPTQVIKEVTRIQREFLWGVVKGGRKLCWINWRVVCQLKKNGGLGVRDIKSVNLSLLLKWRWRLLNREDTRLWKDVLVAKCRNNILHNVIWSNRPCLNLASNWWKDIINIRNGVDMGGECWFGDNIERKLENDESILLWKDEWVDEQRLFEVLVQ